MTTQCIIFRLRKSVFGNVYIVTVEWTGSNHHACYHASLTALCVWACMLWASLKTPSLSLVFTIKSLSRPASRVKRYHLITRYTLILVGLLFFSIFTAVSLRVSVSLESCVLCTVLLGFCGLQAWFKYLVLFFCVLFTCFTCRLL